MADMPLGFCRVARIVRREVQKALGGDTGQLGAASVVEVREIADDRRIAIVVGGRRAEVE